MTTAVYGRNYLPDESFVPRGRWTFASGFFGLEAFVGQIAIYIDIPAVVFHDKLPFDDFYDILQREVFVSEEQIVQSVTQAVSLLQGFVFEQFQRKGVAIDSRISVGVAFLKSDFVCVGGLGRLVVGLFREDELHTLLECNEVQVDFVSGYLAKGDLLALYPVTYPIEELCLQLGMEEEDKGALYRAYIATFPSKGVAYLFENDDVENQSELVFSEKSLVLSESESMVVSEEVKLVGDLGEETAQEEEEWVAVPQERWSRKLAVLLLKSMERTGRWVKNARNGFWSIAQPVFGWMTPSRLSVVGLLILIAFGVVVVLGKPYEEVWQKNMQIELSKKQVLPPLQEELVRVKDWMQTSPVRASRALTKLRSDIYAIDPTLQQSVEGRQLIGEVEILYKSLTKSIVAETSLFFDVSTVGDNANVDKMALIKEAILIADTHKDAVYRVDTSTRAARALLGSTDGIGDSFEVIGDETSLYALSMKGVLKLPYSSAEVKTVLDQDNRWNKPVAGDLFGNNLYIFDTGASQVWKYAGSESGFGSGTAYLASSREYGFENGVDLAVDGYIWLGFADGNVARLAQGSVDAFTLESLTDPLQQITALNAPLEHDFLYVLDSKEGRIVQYRKETGGFVQQYVNDQLSGAQDLVIDPIERKGYFAKGSLIYRFNLQ